MLGKQLALAGLLCSIAFAAPAPQDLPITVPVTAPAVAASTSTAASSSMPAASSAPSAPSTSAPGPVVELEYATYQGSNASGIVNFLGMRFAQPPVGDLRFNLPLPPLNMGSDIQQATARGAQCTQQQFTDGFADGVPSSVIDQVEALPVVASGARPGLAGQEDCLFLNVQTPSNITAGQTLPVLVWIYGGGFEFGSASYDATPLIKRSQIIGTPVIVVSMNYRLNAFGFMASKETELAGVGNAWLYDQRLALRWIQDNISKFGGDPTKVTLWGESAGSISIALHMVAYDGDLTMPHTPTSNTSLFRGAFMESGAQLPTGSQLNGQEYYDIVAAAANCTGLDPTASLDCLRHTPYDQVVAGMDMTPSVLSYQALRNAWLPRTDGLAIRKDAQQLVEEGKIAAIPFIIGDCDDEGTLFSAASANITTNAQALKYIQTNYLLGSTDAEIESLALHYPQDPTQGSPFNTGYLNQLTPQFKRISAFAGDYAFQAPRRFFLNKVASLGKANIWSYNYSRGKAIPFLGAFHSSELSTEFQASMIGGVDNEGLDYLINFCVALDPNSAGNAGIIHWPQWTPTVPSLLTFLDRPLGGLLGLSITLDTYRSAAMEYVTLLSRKYPM